VDPSTGLVAVALRAPDSIAVLDPDGRPLRRIDVPAPAAALPRAFRLVASYTSS
jgi:hypothetical protein